MSDTPVNSPSKYHHLFSKKTSHIEKNEVLSYITSIWEYGRTEWLENNQWKCLWCNLIFEGINSTKDIYVVIITRIMHINILFSEIYQYHSSRYKDLQIIKDANNGLINNYLHNMISSI